MKTILSRLAERRAAAEAGGAPELVAAQHAEGKLTARERIELLFDEGSFEELDMFVGPQATGFGLDPRNIPGDGVVTGFGTISGRAVFVFAQDVTAFGGSLSEAHARKIAKVQDMALRGRAPIIGLFESAGVRIQDGVAALGGYGEMFQRNVLASGVIPQISVIMGPCTGGDVHAPAMTDFIFMVAGTSHMFVSGPDIVKAVTNETVTPDELGGARVHTVESSVADGAFENDVEALLQVRRLVDFLPSSNVASLPEWPAPRADGDDPSLDTLAPDDPGACYDLKALIAKVADDADFFEIQATHAKNIVIGFGRVEGRPVGFVANQPMELGGALDSNAVRKAARFVRFCDCFSIPLVTFVDVPGFLPGVAEERGGLIKHSAKLLYAYAEATVPKITIVTRKAFGSAYAVMASKHLRGDLNFAWPGARIGIMGAKGAAEILRRVDIDDVEAWAKDYEARFLSPFVAAERGYIDDIIMPASTRRRVARGLAMLRGKTLDNPWRKHGNIPL